MGAERCRFGTQGLSAHLHLIAARVSFRSSVTERFGEQQLALDDIGLRRPITRLSESVNKRRSGLRRLECAAVRAEIVERYRLPLVRDDAEIVENPRTTITIREFHVAHKGRVRVKRSG